MGTDSEVIGVDLVLFGSDFPHAEGLADPTTYVDDLRELPDEVARKIMGGDLARLVNVDVLVGSTA